jgi:dienelactone hydrolase
MGSLRALVRVLVVTSTALLLFGACSGDDQQDLAGAATSSSAAATVSGSVPGSQVTTTQAEVATAPFEVGISEVTFVDESRPTPASGDEPSREERVLESVVYYPSHAENAGPFPLVVFSHGLGGTPEFSQPLLERWAAAGFVVVAPRFPLSRPDNPGGPDAGDVQNQTGDVSFLIDEMTGESVDPSSPFAGLVDPDSVGVSGHSNGAITTIGTIAHSCCFEPRVDAAITFAGTASPFARGEYDWPLAPSYLLIHGTEDSLVSYSNAVSIYNKLESPKGLLTLKGGDHGSMFAPAEPSFEDVATATTDFWLAHLRDDPEALQHLDGIGETEASDLRWAGPGDALDVIPTTTIAGIDRQVSANPTSALSGGDVVTVSWSGFTSDGTINVVQCSEGGDDGAGFCDLTLGRILIPNPSGSGSLELEIVVGAVGDGECGAGIDDCVVVVNDSGLSDEDATIRIPVSFL